MDFLQTIEHFYGAGDSELKSLLLVHSRAVADKALRICDAHPELGLDRDFIEAAAMLHDIGIVRCDAPGIHCFGAEPYIKHGILGAEMLNNLDSEFSIANCQLSRVCQRHTGAGITRAEVIAQHLPLPLPDDGSEPYMPETVAEKLICYADKFFSKTRLDHEKTIAEAERSLAKFGEDGVRRFREWAQLFE
ncbi:MAG: HDIG domain-containing protein [Prevotella sp.]|nr:HDIG domain-containing protein [Prevotella sp.]